MGGVACEDRENRSRIVLIIHGSDYRLIDSNIDS